VGCGLKKRFIKVLLGLSWVGLVWFQVEFSAEEEDSDSVVVEDAEASRGGLDGLNAAACVPVGIFFRSSCVQFHEAECHTSFPKRENLPKDRC